MTAINQTVQRAIKDARRGRTRAPDLTGEDCGCYRCGHHRIKQHRETGTITIATQHDSKLADEHLRWISELHPETHYEITEERR
jgi:hypothetical protein